MNPTEIDDAILTLADLRAEVNFEALRTRLIPPPRFKYATLAAYLTDKDFPSQDNAKIEIQRFIDRLNRKTFGMQRLLANFNGNKNQNGLYLDGVFGVGKTHLLASVFHAARSPKKLYLSFTELVYFIGLLGLEKCAAEMAQYSLICIDEFELDDPGNTTMSLGLLTRVMEKNVAIVTTSNTPPLRLGEGRFDVRNFQREIGEISKRFKTIQIDGKDYRQKLIAEAKTRNSTWQMTNLQRQFQVFQATAARKKILLSETSLFELLRKFHPMHYFELAEKLGAVFLDNIGQIKDQFDALRFVYFIDKLYDDTVQIFASANIEIDSLFPEEFYKSAYAKKYWRCISRLKEICR